MSVGSSDWLECAKWLNKLNLLTDLMRHRLERNELKLVDFAFGLHDGVILCNLINKLIPGRIDITKINYSPLSILASYQNTKRFLEVLEIYFQFKQQDLFKPEMLYNMEIKYVLKTLAKLSQTKVAQKIVKNGFTLSCDNLSAVYYNYYYIKPNEELFYLLDSLVAENNNYELCDKMELELSERKSNGSNVKVETIVKHIYVSEVQFVYALGILTNDFLKPLSKTIHDRDRQYIYINIEALKFLHSLLATKLHGAYQYKRHNSTSYACKVFDSLKQRLIEEYLTYFNHIQTAINKVSYLIKENKKFRKVLAECRDESQMGVFKFSDYMILPYRRLFQYRYLFGELYKQTDEEHEAKTEILTIWAGLGEIMWYLNESVRDYECLKRTENLSKRLRNFNFTNSTKIHDYGYFIKAFCVRIKANNRIKRRALLLFEKVLFICKLKDGNYYYEDTILINGFKLDENESDSALNLKIMIHNTYDSTMYTLYFKNKEEKNEWKKCIFDALDKIYPNGFNSNDHSFSLKDFGKKLIGCQLCKKLLYGIFQQGYECRKCHAIVHKSCSNRYPTFSWSVFLTERSIMESMPQFFLGKCSGPSSNSHFFDKAVHEHEYKGRQIPKIRKCLKFDRNEEITETGDDDNNVDDKRCNDVRISLFDNGSRKVLSPVSQLGSTNNLHFFDEAAEELEYEDRPILKSSCPILTFDRNGEITYTDDVIEIELRSWYCDVNQDLAQKILKNIANKLPIFLVRPYQDNGYAISIKLNNNIAHIKIHAAKIDIDEIYYFLIEQNRFLSITQLIQYYMNNSLESNFPQLQTKLGIPFREALPSSIGYATALDDYFTNHDDTVELKRGEKVSVIEKNASGWWLVYKNNGYLGFAPDTYLQESNY